MFNCKLTPEITEIIVQNIEKGNSYETASQAVGICRDTIYDWINRGKKGEEPFLHFLQSIKKARAKAEMRHVEVIEKAMDKNWQASAWWLERTNRDQWGIKTEQKIEHTGKITLEQFRSLFKDNATTNTKPVSIPNKDNTEQDKPIDNKQKQTGGN